MARKNRTSAQLLEKRFSFGSTPCLAQKSANECEWMCGSRDPFFHPKFVISFCLLKKSAIFSLFATILGDLFAFCPNFFHDSNHKKSIFTAYFSVFFFQAILGLKSKIICNFELFRIKYWRSFRL